MAAPSVAQQHSQSASYTQSGFCTKMGWGSQPALLLIDVCKAYWTPGSPLDISSNPAAAASPASMRRLLSAARAGGVPVIWTAVEYTDPSMKDAGLFWHKAKALDLWQVGDPRGLSDWVDDSLRPVEGEVLVKKKYASGFFGTTLATELACRGVDTVVIAGVSTSGCVRATTLDAMQSGYRPMVVDAACGDRSPEIHNANMFDMNAKYADVVTEEEAVEHLNSPGRA